MKFSNLKYISTDNRFATVDVTTGFWLWSKTKSYTIYKEPRSSEWRWLNTGAYINNEELNYLESAAAAKIELAKRKLFS